MNPRQRLELEGRRGRFSGWVSQVQGILAHTTCMVKSCGLAAGDLDYRRALNFAFKLIMKISSTDNFENYRQSSY